MLRGKLLPADARKLIAVRRRARPGAMAAWRNRGEGDSESDEGLLKGQLDSSGVAGGPVRIIGGPAEFAKLQPGDVLVCTFTDLAWTPLFSLAAAVVADTGGSFSPPLLRVNTVFRRFLAFR